MLLRLLADPQVSPLALKPQAPCAVVPIDRRRNGGTAKQSEWFPLQIAEASFPSSSEVKQAAAARALERFPFSLARSLRPQNSLRIRAG